MPLLMGGIVLGARRPAELHADTQAQPPYAQAREPQRAVAGERWTVVDLDGLRQAVAPEDLHERAAGLRIVSTRQLPDGQAIPGSEVAHGEWLDTCAVGGVCAPLEVRCPHVIGPNGALRWSERHERPGAGASFATPGQTSGEEPAVDGANRRNPRPWPAAFQLP